jgi:hypothetical protein
MNELPLELIRHIFSFGDPAHRRHVRVLNEKIKDIQFTRQRIFNMIFEDAVIYSNLNSTCIAFGIINVFKMCPLHVKRKIFKLCTTCVCCETHCSNKPRTLDYSNNTPFQHGSRCLCYCRSFARKMYKAYRFPIENVYSEQSIIIRNLS